jgi:hypothetical protein
MPANKQLVFSASGRLLPLRAGLRVKKEKSLA